MTLRRSSALALAAMLAAGAAAAAQSVEKFTARLSWIPSAGNVRVTGKGSASAVLSGTKLTITGSFEGLSSPATAARLHRGVAKGARGSPIADLTVTKDVNGAISGTVDLTPDQIESLKQGRLYIQIHSEKAPEDGSNLWGWLLR